MERKEKIDLLNGIIKGKYSILDLKTDQELTHLVGYDEFHPYYINQKPVSQDQFSLAFERQLKDNKKKPLKSCCYVDTSEELLSKKPFIIKKERFK